MKQKRMIFMGIVIVFYLIFNNIEDVRGCDSTYTDNGDVEVRLSDNNSTATVKANSYPFSGGYNGVYNIKLLIGSYTLYINSEGVTSIEVRSRRTSTLCVAPSYTVATVRDYKK